ncbi:hypothetical protein TRFO_02048 [Tritrichomonas foetus]|uniref:Uncharacterized protein n=1 Tax=Tritrichomonas foetus TaxID=1144522 RepID=A0A1J4JCM1_9EUKA|nr:hypothetical protein TRFO_02048 [Tritrichomonas foetus]|eukprot:OHS96926.1 hypothetical protein TRFO_02048 [Tritrichomonas foetus]
MIEETHFQVKINEYEFTIPSHNISDPDSLHFLRENATDKFVEIYDSDLDPNFDFSLIPTVLENPNILLTQDNYQQLHVISELIHISSLSQRITQYQKYIDILSFNEIDEFVNLEQDLLDITNDTVDKIANQLCQYILPDVFSEENYIQELLFLILSCSRARPLKKEKFKHLLEKFISFIQNNNKQNSQTSPSSLLRIPCRNLFSQLRMKETENKDISDSDSSYEDYIEDSKIDSTRLGCYPYEIYHKIELLNYSLKQLNNRFPIELNDIKQVILKDDEKMLLQLMSNPTFEPKTKYLHFSARNSSIKCFKCLLVNVKNIEENIINDAIIGGNIEIIRLCLDQFKTNDILKNDKKVKTLLYTSIKYHQINVFEWLIENYITMTNNWLIAILKKAILYDNYLVMKYIFTNHYDISFLLFYSVNYNNEYISKFLLKSVAFDIGNIVDFIYKYGQLKFKDFIYPRYETNQFISLLVHYNSINIDQSSLTSKLHQYDFPSEFFITGSQNETFLLLQCIANNTKIVKFLLNFKEFQSMINKSKFLFCFSFKQYHINVENIQ